MLEKNKKTKEYLQKTTNSNVQEMTWKKKISTRLFQLANQSHPGFQIMYLILLFGGYSIFITEVHPFLPNPFLSSNHKIIAFFLVFLSLVLFLLISFKDPGVITSENISSFQNLYPYHKVLFPQDKICPTCHLPKLPRSKHCRVCGKCIARLDHHCIWMNNCIGAKNYGYFLAFLFITFITSTYTIVVVTGILIFKAHLLMESRQIDVENLLDALHYTIVNCPSLTLLSSLAFAVWFAVGIYFGIQLKRTLRNVTSNESFKRDDFLCEIKTKETNRPQLDATWGGILGDTLDLDQITEFSTEDVNDNPYDRGIWNNLREAFLWNSYTKQKIH